MKPIIHGELVLIPTNKKITKTESKKSYVAAHSETGHNHVLQSDIAFDVGMIDNEIAIRVKDKAELVHQKSFDNHRTLLIEEGTYILGKATEYDPWQKVMREIWD